MAAKMCICEPLALNQMTGFQKNIVLLWAFLFSCGCLLASLGAGSTNFTVAKTAPLAAAWETFNQPGSFIMSLARDGSGNKANIQRWE
jgi:hypothetical protein